MTVRVSVGEATGDDITRGPSRASSQRRSCPMEWESSPSSRMPDDAISMGIQTGRAGRWIRQTNKENCGGGRVGFLG